MDLPQALQLWLIRLLEPLIAASRSPLYRRDLLAALGVDLTAGGQQQLQELAAALEECAPGFERLLALDTSEPSPEILELLLQDSQALVEAARTVADNSAVIDPTSPDAQRILSNLLSLLTVKYLSTYSPLAFDLATALTLIRIPDPDQGELLPVAELERLPRLLSDPTTLLSEFYLGSEGLQTPEQARQAADRLFPRIATILRRIGVNARYARDPRLLLPEAPGVADRPLTLQLPIGPSIGTGLTVTLRSEAEGGSAVVLAPFGAGRFSYSGADWTVTAALLGEISGFAVGRGGVSFPDEVQDVTIGADFSATRKSSSQAFRSSASGTRLEIGQLQLRGGATFRSDYEADVALEVSPAALVVSPGDGDGFLQQILPQEGMRADFDLALGWSNRRGLYFRGGASLETTLPIHLSLLGVLNLDSVYLSVQARDDSLRTTAAAAVSVKLGPVTADIDRVGLLSDLTFPPDGGNLGIANIELDFKPPSGVGLSIDAGAVTGGGFLFFDPEEEQYAGAVHLEIEGGISLNAIGLLTTRLPDGSKGFSLLVIVTASGFNPIQLGFGFTLNGVGGLLGINRTVAVDVLRAGVRSRALEPILFSREDPIPRAPAIISTLRSVFPPARDRYVFGPMAMIGWGTPTVLTIEVAVLLELLAPLRLIVLGRLRALLPGPDERAALVKLNMDVLGVVDFDRREVSIDATLYDSYVSAFAISGDMALRASWGERPGFALAVGGFHPRFQPPPEFPALRRLAISLSTSNTPRLRLEAYLAITPNTVQIGARLDLYVEALGFNLAGMLSFDALVQFAPFGLDLEVAGMLALRRGTSTLMGLELRMRLTGPAPWHARGEASFRILFIKITIGFDARFGEERLQRAPEPVEIWPLLSDALSDERNWGAELPGEGSALATVRAVDPPPGEVLVHPNGEVSVRQRVLPLERDVSRFANAPPADYRRFRIASISAGGNTLVHQTTYEPFPPAQFEDMPDDRKLASPGFDPMPAGTRASGVAAKAGPDLAVMLGYETIVIEPPGAPPAQPLPGTYTPSADTLALLAETGAAATAEIRRSGRAKFAADGEAAVAVSDPEFTVVTREGLTPPEDPLPTDGSFTSAREELRRLVAESPRYRGNVQVVRREEALV